MIEVPWIHFTYESFFDGFLCDSSKRLLRTVKRGDKRNKRKAFSECERERERDDLAILFWGASSWAGFIIENENFQASTCERIQNLCEIF